MKRVSFETMQCSIAQTLEVVGEWWTLLVLREVFFGRRRFGDMVEDLGIARNILTDRLNKLVDEKILVRHDITGTGGRYEYRLTDQGREIFPVLIALMQWGDRWRKLPKGAPTELVHRTCNHKTAPVLVCSHCGEPLSAADVAARPGRRFRHDRDHPLVRANAPSS
jgi:DNA-binding HxlR family transcriptional regulator